MSEISKLIEDLKRFDTAKISDILNDMGFKVSMSSAIKPLCESMKIYGPAVTIEAIPSISPKIEDIDKGLSAKEALTKKRN